MSKALLPEKTTTKSIVCSSCKCETGITLTYILSADIDEGIKCPFCETALFSVKPEQKVWGSTTYTPKYTGGAWDGYGEV